MYDLDRDGLITADELQIGLKDEGLHQVGVSRASPGGWQKPVRYGSQPGACKHSVLVETGGVGPTHQHH